MSTEIKKTMSELVDQDVALLAIEKKIRELLTFKIGRNLLKQSFPNYLIEEKLENIPQAWKSYLCNSDTRLEHKFTTDLLTDALKHKQVDAITYYLMSMIIRYESEITTFIKLWQLTFGK